MDSAISFGCQDIKIENNMGKNSSCFICFYVFLFQQFRPKYSDLSSFVFVRLNIKTMKKILLVLMLPLALSINVQNKLIQTIIAF
jgi:hypothetical protein